MGKEPKCLDLSFYEGKMNLDQRELWAKDGEESYRRRKLSEGIKKKTRIVISHEQK